MCEDRSPASEQPPGEAEETMWNSSQRVEYRRPAIQSCAVCGRQFGLIRHYSWRTALCSRKCLDHFKARRERDRLWLIRFERVERSQVALRLVQSVVEGLNFSPSALARARELNASIQNAGVMLMKVSWQRSIRLAIAVVLLIGSGGVLAIARPHAVSDPVLGLGWQCTRTAFIVTCSHAKAE